MIAWFAAALTEAWKSTSSIEIMAAVLAVAYLLFAIRQLQSCWVAAFVSSGLYVWVFFAARLYMDSILNVFYAVMAGYGFFQWRHRSGGDDLRVTRWALSRHVWALLGVVLLSLGTAFLLRRFTAAASPFLDSLVTWSSIYTTYLVARKVYENWYWWLVIDSVSLGLYLTRGLYLTVLLFGFYIVLIFVGMREWRRTLPAYAVA